MSKKPKNQEEVFQLFSKMKLVHEKSNLFENPQFLKWTGAVTKGYKDSLAADMAIALTLAGQRGDEALAKMIVEAKEVSSTKNVATRLEEAQIKNWLSKGETPDNVFRALKIEKDGYISLRNPLLGTWVSYVKKIEENPYKLLLSKMRARNSDDIVATYIWSAKRDVLGSTIAQKVEDVLLDSWMPQSADEVFKLLKLNTGGINLFNYPRLSSWVSYVTKIERKQADEQMYTVLKAAYGDDELATILAASKQSALGDVAKRLEEVQHKPALHSWVDYVTTLSKKNADELMLSALKTSYKDDFVLAKMFVAAKESSSTKAIAGKLEQAQMKDWLRNEKSADEVFKLLKLDADVDNLLTNPLLSNWVSYVEKLNEDPYTMLLGKLKTSKRTATDDKLVEMIMRAKTETSTSSIAGKLEAAQLEKWLNEKQTAPYYTTDTKLAEMVLTGRSMPDDMSAKFEKIILNKWLAEKKSADDVFDFVLKESRDQALESPYLNTWVSYVEKLDKEDPYKTMFLVLQKRFDETELNYMLSHAAESSHTGELGWRLIQEMWLSGKESAQKVFSRLHLDRAGSTLFKQPDLAMWISHVTRLDAKNADKKILAVLQSFYSKKQLTKMLSAAKEVDETKAFATRMEKQLLLNQGN
ncbi:hypothetical protein PF006_g11351 [Phytophthora fragariae]|uniref:RxLR effector PexRD54 WY domain-containing protein n=3 Tax=Phytophthora fragariae TaxID=53985 RepID=A0A6A3U9H7_9STRA|nr:hypothetical protein PF009_g27567 [Phytophthora fragariae]KAE9143638.1 hypothetical protein PF006_g11351 [Phytophthora fragariae]